MMASSECPDSPTVIHPLLPALRDGTGVSSYCFIVRGHISCRPPMSARSVSER